MYDLIKIAEVITCVGTVIGSTTFLKKIFSDRTIHNRWCDSIILILIIM